jgi:hypothetical protein
MWVVYTLIGLVALGVIGFSALVWLYRALTRDWL